MKIAFILQICGIMFILVFLILAIAMLKDFVVDTIRNLKWKYKYKHRFDKPPLAKCYCKDCRYYISEGNCGDCATHNGWKVADNWFCWSAKPKSYDYGGSKDK